LLISPQEAASELLRRRKARTSFGDYIAYLDIGLEPARHHRLLIEELQAVERGEIQRLMVLMPPGSAKSTYSSVLFPPYAMGRQKRAVLGVSNTQTLAELFSRRARNLVASKEHARVFGNSLSADVSAAGSWEATNGSEYFAAGVGGTITGRRADLGLIDDPVKSREEADSENTRNKHWEWYVNDFETRLKPNSRQIVIQTRWHEDDLAGRILQREAAKWRVIKLPMEAGANDPLGRKPGERLWADWFTEDMIATAKLDRRKWSALYQQEPAPDEGTFFKREWFELFDPKGIKGHAYTTGDFAVTEGDGDYTEVATHKYLNDTLYLACDGWRGQTSADVWFERLIDQFAEHKPLCFFGETGPIRRSIEPFLTKRMRDRRAFCRLEWLPRGHDKATMARPLQAMAASKRVKIADTPYGHQLLNQLLQFPAGKLDDGVDMAALMGLAIDQSHPAIMRPTVTGARRDSWDEERVESSWKTA
jgi:hypothetical protein